MSSVYTSRASSNHNSNNNSNHNSAEPTARYTTRSSTHSSSGSLYNSATLSSARNASLSSATLSSATLSSATLSSARNSDSEYNNVAPGSAKTVINNDTFSSARNASLSSATPSSARNTRSNKTETVNTTEPVVPRLDFSRIQQVKNTKNIYNERYYTDNSERKTKRKHSSRVSHTSYGHDNGGIIMTANHDDTQLFAYGEEYGVVIIKSNKTKMKTKVTGRYAEFVFD